MARPSEDAHRWARALLALALAAVTSAPSPSAARPQEAAAVLPIQEEPRTWLPSDEALSFKVEATFGPVRGLDLGHVTLSCLQAPSPPGEAEAVAASAAERPRPLALIEAKAKGGYLGRTVDHSIVVRWFAGYRPRIECVERLRGSRVGNRELRIGEDEGRWTLEHRKDRHCKGCEDRAHFKEGFLPWSKPSHCGGCELLLHRVWRDPKKIEVPPHSVDIVSALYLARGFLRSPSDSTSISLVNQDQLWRVNLRRGEERKIETPAGAFECTRILMGPELAAGDGPGKQAAERFEALFGLHGDISLWVDRARGFPVVIEGTAPFGPFDVHVKASLTALRGG